VGELYWVNRSEPEEERVEEREKEEKEYYSVIKEKLDELFRETRH
jgi:hypothetical protein